MFRICERILSIVFAFYGAYEVYAGDIRLGLAISIIAILMHIPDDDQIAKASLIRITVNATEQSRKS